MKKVYLHINKRISGFSLIEVLLTVAIFSMFIVALLGVLSIGEESSSLGGKRTQAVFLAEEGLEALRNIRDENFTNLVDGPYGLVKAGNQWDFSALPDVTDIFTRTINISTVDANTKLIISTVLWQQNLQRNGNVVLTTYLTNWKPF
ncbi:MAG: prepilin-type N-terminal cleavage/methylation domain-containing protein [Candidatus Paceibacterota bacterium]|jgi:prepilin-type N-terminal cleavage/methylation domain-containing protein